jgi:hypothetical protein
VTTDRAYTPENTRPPIRCLVCGGQLALRTARGRKSGKTFLMLVCPRDGRHFRGFITDRKYVGEVLSRLEGRTRPVEATDDLGHGNDLSRSSTTKLERPTQDVEL